MSRTAEEYYAMHQKAFRVSFDYLNAHFPPADSVEYWTQTGKDGQEACAKVADNPLLIRLMTAVVEYLEEEGKRRNQDGTA